MASVIVAGDVSGTCTLQAPSAAGSTVLTLPVIATDTLAGIAATQTLTNKTLVAPALGTPASGVLTNCTGVVASALPAGSVLQVVQGTLTSETSTTSATMVDMGLTVTLTPRATSSKVLILVHGSGYADGGTSTYASIQLNRGASSVIIFDGIMGYSANSISNGGSFNTAYLDSPSTTSATIYKVQYKRAAGGGSLRINNNASVCTITAMEIQG